MARVEYVCATGQDCSAFENRLMLSGTQSTATFPALLVPVELSVTKNGVTVGFADLSKQGEDGKVTSALGTDASGNLQAQSNVTIIPVLAEPLRRCYRS